MRGITILRVVTMVAVVCLVASVPASAQGSVEGKLRQLEDRVIALEDYAERLQESLNEFTSGLLQEMDRQMDIRTSKVVSLNIISSQFTNILTNTGIFYISVKKREKIEGGYRLYFQIGNPNMASYGGFELKLRWGRKWDPDRKTPTFQQWRESLNEAEYRYSGKVEPGRWTEFSVDITPADTSNFSYLEGEMFVQRVELLGAE